MTFIKLKVPTLVQDIKVEGKSQYYLRPVFIAHPISTNLRYELAVAQYQKELKHFFKGFSVDRSNAQDLLWFTFDPDLETHRFHFEFSLGKEYIKGPFLCVIFEWQNYLFGCLPGFDHFMYVLGDLSMRLTEQRNRTEEVVRFLLREYQEEDSEFDPINYYAGRRDFVTTVEVGIHINEKQLKFERDTQNWFFSNLQESEDFNGAIELERVGQDLNSRYPNELDRAFFQDELVDRLYQLIFRRSNTSLAIIGPEGVGKTAVIEEVIWRYLEGYYHELPGESMQHVWQIDPNRIISGMSVVGMWQKRFEAIIQHLRYPDGRDQSDKMLVNNPVSLLRIGKSASNNMSLSDVLKSYIDKRQLQLILLATPEEWKVIQDKDRRFSDLFQVVRMAEPSPETTAKIVLRKRRRLELENSVEISIQAIQQLMYIQRNFLQRQALPGSVLNLMQRLATKYRFRTVDADEVREEFRAYSGLRDFLFDSSLKFNTSEVKNLLAQELVGQEKAVQALSDIINLLKAKLNDPNRPASSFLFIGPTGVGKTQAAKVLCRHLSGDEHQLLRFDMNEYIDELAVYRLIGDENNPEGQLTGKVRYQPFGVLLLDEIEKAHPSVHDLLLQVLDDGRLTDSLGQTVDFTNTIIIMTSNVGAEDKDRQLGFRANEQDDSVYLKAVQQHFRPEFINRINKIVVFNPLGLEDILRIARLQIKELLKRDGFVRRTTILNISQDALAWVARRGYDAKMGGRALKRQIEKDLTTLSAEQLISTKTDTPIIFEILLRDDKLYPRILPLDFLTPISGTWLPEMPAQDTGRRFFRKLLNVVTQLENRVNQMDGDSYIPGTSSAVDWQYYDFKEKIAQAKEDLQTKLLTFSEHYFPGLPAIPLRLRSGSLIPRKDWSRGVREYYRDRIFQEEGLKQIGETHQYQQDLFDSLETEFIRYYLNVGILRLVADGFFQGRREQVKIHLESCITGLGRNEVQFLLELYANFLDHLDIHYTLDKKQQFLQAEGYNISQLLRGEQGLQLFYTAHQNPVPIRLSLEVNGQASGEAGTFKVIRLFDSQQIMTDLRSGFTNAVNINPEEFKILVFAGLPKAIREYLFD
ncbi:AAA family ATPase [Flavilitoribacter nigricans]|uniref:Molecular chaperone n=1 Tax=Flavilitoribacter nigricans (strain ATCC 23147 / DSM 23189 / NBRC 102662 / NCIMB 1420 / SS-2) TaxID=1122177 RepID=A0A2D0NHR4_FLAN2|nr:AAA family ATPase [Flavilitoribacter nigricans]PHN07709.1 molecular chaperone [Flavilitoribacter nigricans DSM 23189 = NBRC 102662]